MPTQKVVPACEIQPGECFRKLRGSFAYLRISDSSLKAYQVPGRTKYIFGVSYNGNMAKVEYYAMVVRVEPETMQINREAEEHWNKQFSNPLITDPEEPDEFDDIGVIDSCLNSDDIAGISSAFEDLTEEEDDDT